MIKVEIRGLDKTLAGLAGMQKQVRYAASRALNTVAFGINSEVKEDMKRRFQGGVTPWVQRAFKVDKATRENLTAIVALRDDQSYIKTLGHLFTGGTRQWKALEGWLKARSLIPDGYMAVPGDAITLDARGNIPKSRLNEMLGVLGSNIRNLRIQYRRDVTRNKVGKDIGFFVVLPGSLAAKHLHVGIWRRIEQGDYRSAVQPYVMYVRRGRWRQFIDLQKIGEFVVRQKWQGEFDKEFAAALRSAR